MTVKNSQIPNFYKKTRKERLEILRNLCNLTNNELDTLETNGSLNIETAEKLIENFVSNMEIPMGIATNFKVNGKDYLIPMAVEEPSVIAACSNGAKIARTSGGFHAIASDAIMYGQIQITELEDTSRAKIDLLMNKDNILNQANSVSKTLVSLNKGAKDIHFRSVNYDPRVLILELEIDVGDAMGANVINSMLEVVSPLVEEISGGFVVLKILSNLTPLRIARAYAIFPSREMGGENIVDRFIHAAKMAEEDIFRAATHNKGIMNGIDSVLLATLNDWRQAEANAHAYASISGRYTSLTKYSKTKGGDVLGTIEIPLSVGTVGGTSSSVEKAIISKKILGVSNAIEFEEVLACVGLAQNFAAMRALSDEGIQKGHMALHSKNLAISAGATGIEIELVANELIRSERISMSNAKTILDEIRNKKVK
jgi:hydroxymethylglutaryl-CoA reductase